MENKNLPTGWICPICGRVNAPTLGTCPCYLTQGIQNKKNTGFVRDDSMTHFARNNSFGKSTNSSSNIYTTCETGLGRNTENGVDTGLQNYCSKRGY